MKFLDYKPQPVPDANLEDDPATKKSNSTIPMSPNNNGTADNGTNPDINGTDENDDDFAPESTLLFLE